VRTWNLRNRNIFETEICWGLFVIHNKQYLLGLLTLKACRLGGCAGCRAHRRRELRQRLTAARWRALPAVSSWRGARRRQASPWQCRYFTAGWREQTCHTIREFASVWNQRAQETCRNTLLEHCPLSEAICIHQLS
jgi:hypothetical protein